MFKMALTLLFRPVYPVQRPECGDVPDYLTLREMADLPAYHPQSEGPHESRSIRR